MSGLAVTGGGAANGDGAADSTRGCRAGGYSRRIQEQSGSRQSGAYVVAVSFLSPAGGGKQARTLLTEASFNGGRGRAETPTVT